MAELLEANISEGHLDIFHHTLITLLIIKITQAPNSDKHKHNSHYHKDEVNQINADTYTPNHIATETDNIADNTNVDSSDSTTDSAS